MLLTFLLASLHLFCCVTWFPLASLCLDKKQGPEGYHSLYILWVFFLLQLLTANESCGQSLAHTLCLLWIHMMQFPLPFPRFSVFCVSSFLHSRLCYEEKKSYWPLLENWTTKPLFPFLFLLFAVHSSQVCSIPALPVFPQSLFYNLLFSLFLALFFVSWPFWSTFAKHILLLHCPFLSEMLFSQCLTCFVICCSFQCYLVCVIVNSVLVSLLFLLDSVFLLVSVSSFAMSYHAHRNSLEDSGVFSSFSCRSLLFLLVSP